jgi:hypothetical protein
MERIAKSVPKPCYALEHDLTTDVCRQCHVQKECFEAMGSRRQKVTLDKMTFKLVPASFGLHDTDMGEDPELPQIERTYALCYYTVFGRRPKDKIGQHKNLVIRKFRQAGCSLRLFMLANMVGHQQREITVAAKMQREPKNTFSAALLTTEQSITRLDMYREMCRKSFGTFDLGALDTLTKGGYAENDIEKRMLHSEVTAARVAVAYKVAKGGPGFVDHVYRCEELTLDPYWLATEPTYLKNVLKPHLDGQHGTKAINNHRHSVTQVLSQMKRKREWAIAVFQARERIMQQAIGTVLHGQGFLPIDFEFDEVYRVNFEVKKIIDDDIEKVKFLEIESVMQFWADIGKAIQHVHCLRFVANEPTSLLL